MPNSIVSPTKIKKLTASVNETLADRGIRHGVFLEGLKTGEANRVVKFLEEKLQPDLVRQIESGIPSARRLTGLKRLVKANDGLIRSGYREIGKRLKSRLRGVAVTEARFQQAMLKRVVPINTEFTVPNLNVLNNIVTQKPIRGALLQDWIKNAERRDINRVNNALRIGIAQGEHSRSIIARIRGTEAANFTDGVMKISKNEAHSLVRTSVNNVAAEAREATYRENDDIIKEVQYVATLDSRTTEICGSLDGRVFPIGEGPRPPQHFNCRSTTVPITKSWKELGINLKEAPAGTRASMNGQVSDKITFGPWLKKQPNWVQEKVLGPNKAAIFRKGNLKIRQFTDARNQPLTFTQLKALDSKVGNQELLAPEIKAQIKQFKKNSTEDFQFRFDNSDARLGWHEKVIKRWESGKPFVEEWGKREGRREFFQWLQTKGATIKNPKLPKKITALPKSTPVSGSGKTEFNAKVFNKMDTTLIDDPFTKKAIERSLVVLEKQYPKVFKNGFGKLETLAGKKFRTKFKSDASAKVWNPTGNKHDIVLNLETFSHSSTDINKALRKYKKQNVFQSESVEDIVTHEFGHVMEHSLPQSKVDKIDDFFWDIMDDNKLTKTLTKDLGKYATTDSSEMFAEAFLQMQKGQLSGTGTSVMQMAGLLEVKPVVQQAIGAGSRLRRLLKAHKSATAKTFKTSENWLGALDVETRAAFRSWTASDYTTIRELQLGRTTCGQFPSLCRKAELMEKALGEVPVKEQLAFRGLANVGKNQLKGLLGSKEMTMDALSSFSSSRGKAGSFAGLNSGRKGNSVMIIARTRTGADIKSMSAYSHEKEILMGKGTRFKVTRTTTTQRTNGPTVHNIWVEEI